MTREGAKVVAIYDFGINGDVGYLCLRYNDPSNQIVELDYVVRLKSIRNNYDRRLWRFECPKCGTSVLDLYYIQGPTFICKFCGKLDTIVKIKGYPKAKREASFGSPKKKLLALEKIIKIRERVRRARIGNEI